MFVTDLDGCFRASGRDGQRKNGEEGRIDGWSDNQAVLHADYTVGIEGKGLVVSDYDECLACR